MRKMSWPWESSFAFPNTGCQLKSVSQHGSCIQDAFFQDPSLQLCSLLRPVLFWDNQAFDVLSNSRLTWCDSHPNRMQQLDFLVRMRPFLDRWAAKVNLAHLSQNHGLEFTWKYSFGRQNGILAAWDYNMFISKLLLELISSDNQKWHLQVDGWSPE